MLTRKQVREIIVARKEREKAAIDEAQGSMFDLAQPTSLGGFKIFTCEKCGAEFRSKERHARECKANHEQTPT